LGFKDESGYSELIGVVVRESPLTDNTRGVAWFGRVVMLTVKAQVFLDDGEGFEI
jgi:hypothetical protein